MIQHITALKPSPIRFGLCEETIFGQFKFPVNKLVKFFFCQGCFHV
jgi:hypothetical protein